MVEQQTGNQTITCHWHPTVSTGLSCGQCRRPMCTQCLVQVPVGIRCRECGRAQPLPTFDVRPANYVRASIVAAGIVLLGVIAWSLLIPILQMWAFVAMPLAVGYAAGELISRAVNLKRSRGLMYLAGGSVVVTFLITAFIFWRAFALPPPISLWTILATVGGVLIAVGRVRL